jgi:hypothetical protein
LGEGRGREDEYRRSAHSFFLEGAVGELGERCGGRWVS